MGLLSEIYDEVDVINNKTESNVNVDKVSQLVENTILMIGEANLACFFERYLSYLDTIMHCAEDAKQKKKEEI